MPTQEHLVVVFSSERYSGFSGGQTEKARLKNVLIRFPEEIYTITTETAIQDSRRT